MSYDENERRDTPLALKLKEQIRKSGPMPVDRYLFHCLYGAPDGTSGYYANRPVIGSSGDFITAPEISQVFGELIGLWCVAVWEQMGSPAAFNLIEFGPGRATLMCDLLRAARVRPAMLAAVRVHLLDASGPLMEQQRARLAATGVPIFWPGKFYRADDPNLPAIVIGNEFLDTEPIEQFVRTQHGWAIRSVGLNDDGSLIFVKCGDCDQALARELDQEFPAARLGDIGELYSAEHDFQDALKQPKTMAGLFFDYGHTQSGIGDTLQAVRDHRYEHPLCSPGEADLTAQFDFAAFSRAQSRIRAVDGPITQAEFLGRLGIMERASKLMAANPARAGEIEAGVMRLMAPNGMGTRFKAIGIRSPDVPKLPGF